MRPARILVEVVILIDPSVANEGRDVDGVHDNHRFAVPVQVFMLNYLVLLFASMNSARRCAGSPFMFGKAGIPMPF